MESLNLLSICYSAFTAVFLILSGLAIFMQIIIKLFPAKSAQEDVAPYAALASVLSRIYPGTQITKIEESK